MPWVRIDDEFFAHPKVLAAGPRAIGFAVMALAYCNKYLTDGQVSPLALRAIGANRRDAQALVKAGLWERNGDGWVIHDFADYQPSREQVESERAAARKRMRRVRANRNGTNA